MCVVKVYNDKDVLVDVCGDFDTEDEAMQWGRDYVPVDQWFAVVEVGKKVGVYGC